MIRRSFLKAMALSASGLLLPVSCLQASALARVTDMRFWTAPDHTRIVFDLDKKVSHAVRRLSRPDRVMVDLKNTRWDLDSSGLQLEDPIVEAFRMRTIFPSVAQAEFRVKADVLPRAFILQPMGGRPPRLVVDLQHRDTQARHSHQTEERHLSKASPPRRKRRDAIIVIDPGHGGEDPGAVGAGGTQEKNVALEVAKRFARKLNNSGGFKAYLTRTGDYSVSLRQRVSIARKHDADLFVSLHADAFKTSDARGASVYCLSEKGKPAPDRAIRLLVQRENSADLIGGVDLGMVPDQEVRGILMDLSQRDSLNRALAYGDNLLSFLKQVPSLRLHFRDIKQAGFAVLKAPDIPSVLVEMAFLSNRDEERQLRKKSHQEALVNALTRGTQTFMSSSHLA